MRALVFRHDLAKEAATAVAGRLRRRAYVSRLAPVALEDVPEPVAAEGFVVCRTKMSGICGSDAKQIRLNARRDNPLTALVSFPHVLGHEAVAERLDDGRRVVLNPWLWCRPRGFETLCEACAAGRYPWCRHFRDGALPAGIHIGNCAGAAGVHAERFSAHHSQLFEPPAEMSDEAAVLSDPASVSLRSILLAPPEDGSPVLVYGSGTLALAAVALLAHLYPSTEIWAATRPGPRARLAARMGAQAVLSSRPEELVAQVSLRTGRPGLRPWSGREWLQDGPAVVYDTVGSAETLETALRLVSSGGRVVISGVEPPRRFEWTPLYFKEVHVVGSNGFGIEELRGVRKHAFEHYFDLAREGLDLSGLVTHRYPLERWDEALLTVYDARRSGAVKVLLRP